MVIARVESSNPIRFVSPIGESVPLYSGAAGKAILAFIDEDERRKVIEDLKAAGTQVYASGRAITVEEIQEQIDGIRRDGFAISESERVAAAATVAAPILSGRRVIGSISVTGPVHRFSAAKQDRLRPWYRK